MKYMVICYAMHEKSVASCDMFANEKDAGEFLRNDMLDVYEEEVANLSEKNVQYELDDSLTEASVSSCHGEYEWTWQVVPVKE